MDAYELESLIGEEADRFLVERAAEAMTEKLSLCRKKGRSGWNTRWCDNDYLTTMLEAHVSKGDMVDVLNLAAMILVRRQVLGKHA